VLSEAREGHAGVIYRRNEQLQGSGGGADMDATMEEEHALEEADQQQVRCPFHPGCLHCSFDR
jgi:hypothetical protein